MQEFWKFEDVVAFKEGVRVGIVWGVFYVSECFFSVELLCYVGVFFNVCPHKVMPYVK